MEAASGQKTSALIRAHHTHAWTPPAPPSPLQSTNGHKALRWRAKAAFKDYPMDLLKRANIPLTQLESLALNRSAWQVNRCHCSLSNTPNQPRPTIERRIKTPVGGWYTLVSGFPAPSVEECVAQGSDSNRRQHHWTHHHPWSKRHHQTRWTAKSVCVCCAITPGSCVCQPIRWGKPYLWVPYASDGHWADCGCAS